MYIQAIIIHHFTHTYLHGMCMHTHMYIHTHTQAQTVCVCVHVRMHVCACVRACVHVCVCTYMCMYVNVYRHTIMQVPVSMSMREYGYEYGVHVQACSPRLCVRAHVGSYAWTCLSAYQCLLFSYVFCSTVHLIQPFCVAQLLVPHGANLAIDLG